MQYHEYIIIYTLAKRYRIGRGYSSANPGCKRRERKEENYRLIQRARRAAVSEVARERENERRRRQRMT